MLGPGEQCQQGWPQMSERHPPELGQIDKERIF